MGERSASKPEDQERILRKAIGKHKKIAGKLARQVLEGDKSLLRVMGGLADLADSLTDTKLEQMVKGEADALRESGFTTSDRTRECQD